MLILLIVLQFLATIMLVRLTNEVYNKAEKMPKFRYTNFVKLPSPAIIILLVCSLIPFLGMIFNLVLLFGGWVVNSLNYNKLIGKQTKIEARFNKIFNI